MSHMFRYELEDADAIEAVIRIASQPKRTRVIAKRFGQLGYSTDWPHREQQHARAQHFARLKRGR